MLSFGTDGVRGIANSELTPELLVALGRSAARVLGDVEAPFIIGRDTRISGAMLQAALTTGIASEGIDVVDAGVIPTPGVARLSQEQSAPAAVISASHNPFADNGIKFFAAGGRKLPDEVEQQLELELRAIVNAQSPLTTSTGYEVGRSGRLAKGDIWYGEQLVEKLEGRDLGGLKVVLDCANGAAFKIASEVFGDAGADVDLINDRPDGCNINDACGAVHPEGLQRAVVDMGADVGLAFDGDADRVIAVDNTGSVVDGDQLIAMAALDLKARGMLAENTVVVTVMTNLGFRLSMAENGIEVVETQVGDRYVLEALEQGGFSLGGEQSGHVIFSDMSTTGDGLLTGLLTLDLLARTDRTLAEAAAASMSRLPQVLRNVKVARRDELEGAQPVWDEVAKAQSKLGGDGRVLLRPSGTEPVVRVMVEAREQSVAQQITDELCDTLVSTLG